MATLVDTTMEAIERDDARASSSTPPNLPLSHLHDAEPETDVPEEDEDDDFNFNAPSYYDLTNPALEQRYVNNADGYFSSLAPTPSTVTSKVESFARYDEQIDGQHASAPTSSALYAEEHRAYRHENSGTNMLDTTMAGSEEAEEDELELVLHKRNLLNDREESFEEVFRQYASSSQSSATSSYMLHDLDTSTHSSTTHGHYSPHTSQTSIGSVVSKAGQASVERYEGHASRATKSSFSGDGVSSKWMQPTQSYLRRLEAEQRMREQSYLDYMPLEEKPHRVTRPRSPKLHSKPRPTNRNDPSRMSSTSRELLKIQEERLHLQLEKLKIREFHEKTKVQRPPMNVHPRSTKQLTVPQTPRFEVDNRLRRFQSKSDKSQTRQDTVNSPIAAEKLLRRDFAVPLPSPARDNRTGLTSPHTPKLQTAARAAQRRPPPPVSLKQEKRPPTCSRLKPGGLTQPMTPQLETSRRAATFRRPIEVIDHDAEELSKKFHALPLKKHILEPKSFARSSPAKADTKARLGQPIASKQPTSARSLTRLGASERAASFAAEMERNRQERERRLKARQAGQNTPPKSCPAPIRRPVVPETPPLKSIQLHREYQENFRRKLQEEKEKEEKQRQFKANPIRVTATPPKFEGSSKPVTEVKPFDLPGERYYEQARERLERKRREEEEERLKSSGTFRAKPMPVFKSNGTEIAPSQKPPTQTESPMLATKTRAAERAAFEAAEKERREREQAFREQREQQQRQLEEEEIKRLRHKDMVFHARPVPEVKPFLVKHETKPLTEPISPLKQA